MNEQAPKIAGSGFLDRTLINLREAWDGVSGSTKSYLSGLPRPDLPGDDLEKIRKQMHDSLLARDEVAGRAQAADLGRIYLSLDQVGRARFLSALAEDLNVDRAAVDVAIDGVRAAGDPTARYAAEEALRKALEPAWRPLLSRFTALPEGVKFLVDLRAEMVSLQRENLGIREVSADLQRMLSAWFDVGLLELRNITWDSPAALLEKLIAYEAVHAIRSWDDLKNRLDSDRRCFAFFHPNMPDEPLIFVEVALVNGMAGNVHELLDEEAPAADPRQADTAIFYSISNAQKGLVGISFGNFLIKRVVGQLRLEFPNLKSFATLSPLPGYSHWLRDLLQEAPAEDEILLPAERKALAAIGRTEEVAALLQESMDSADWLEDEPLREALRAPLLRLAASYLSKAKRADGRLRDPVAHFHLSNGARMGRLNWLADRSERGMREAVGIMVNYQYRLADIEKNGEAYSATGKVALSSAVRALAKD